MATTFLLNGLGWATITTAAGANTIPLTGIAYSPNLGREPFRSGGDLSPSMVRRAGARPAFRMTMPLSSAWTIFGQFLPISVTAFTMYEASFTASGSVYLRVGTAATTLSLTPTTGGAIGLISRIYPTGGAVPLMLAEVIILLTATDGLADPVTVSSASLPAAPSDPILHTIAPYMDNATAKWGIESWALDTGIGLEAIQNDGLFYPNGYRLGALQPVISIAHNDVVTLHSNIGDSGKDGTGAGFIVYARAYDAASKSLQTTGYSFTMAKGLAAIESFGAQGTERSKMALTLSAYAAAGALTYPIAVATSATLPT